MFLFFISSQTSDYIYRAAVRELIPQLRYLDDVQVQEEDHHCSSCTRGDDWAVLRHSIRELNLPRADTDGGVCVRVCLFIHVFWLIWSSSVDYRSVLNKLFHLHRGSPTHFKPLQHSSFCQARSSQSLPPQTPVCLQTTHLLHTNDGNKAWSFIPTRVQTRFCRTTSSHGCGGNKQSDTWLDTVLTVFHTDVCAVGSITPHHT